MQQSIKIIYENHGDGIHVADTLLLIRWGLELAGYRADIENMLVPGHLNILLENFSDEFTDKVLKLVHQDTCFIIVATEFLTGNTFNDFSLSSMNLSADTHYDQPAYWVSRYCNFMRLSEHALAVWHLCEHQVPLYRIALPSRRVEYLPHGYVSALRRVVMRPDSERDIDFLFTGTLTSYRRKILATLEEQGYRVYAASVATGHFHREQLLARTCIALNLRQHPDWPYPSNSRFHYHLNNASLLLSERCYYSCDLDVYMEQSNDIVKDAIANLRCGCFGKRAESSLTRFSEELPMKPLMAALMKASLTQEMLVWFGIEKINESIIDSEYHEINRDCIEILTKKKPEILVLLSTKMSWQEHLFMSLDEVFNIHAFYMEDIIEKLGDYNKLISYINDYIDNQNISFVFLNYESNYGYLNSADDIYCLFKEIKNKRIYILLFDDVVYHERNLEFIKNIKYEMILTACPLSALKYQEYKLPAAFFPLEGHQKWYFSKNTSRDIDVLFYGSLCKGKRAEYLSQIRQAGLFVTYVGDEKRSLSVTELCAYLRRSKIVLNFSESFYDHAGAIYYQFKGRILEAGFCGALCVSERNPSASIIFDNYLPQFNTIEECINLLNRFLRDSIYYEKVRKEFVLRSELYRPVGIIKNIFGFYDNLIMKNEYAIHQESESASASVSESNSANAYGFNHSVSGLKYITKPMALPPIHLPSLKNNSAWVIGNGASLRGFDLSSLNGTVTIGMNAAYRHWERIGWYPSYYICLDPIVTESHRANLYRLIQNSADNGIQGFLIRQSLVDAYPALLCHPRVILFEDYRASRYFADLNAGLTTGSFAPLFAAMLGYRRVVLLGIDLNYGQHVLEAKMQGGIVAEIVRTPRYNPNYFFDDYQRQGDRYNILDFQPDLHYRSWVGVKQRLDELGVDVINGNPHSRIACLFDSLTIDALQPT